VFLLKDSEKKKHTVFPEKQVPSNYQKDNQEFLNETVKRIQCPPNHSRKKRANAAFSWGNCFIVKAT
jgi:hypothetical protein